MTHTHTEDKCFTSLWLDKPHHDRALMGPAHAISGLGAFFLLVGIAMIFRLFELDGSTLVLLILSFIVVTGGALIPDLDNTKSTVQKALGISGGLATAVARQTSIIVQTIFRTSRDDATPNPHRGFWHTIVGAVTLGFAVWGLTRISYEVPIPFVGDIALGHIIAFIVMIGCLNISIAGLGYDLMGVKKATKKNPVVGEFISLLVSGAVVGLLLILAPENDYSWLGISLAVGCIIHILGDSLTKAGVPLFFPIIALWKGKMWWTTRFTKLSADDDALNGFVRITSILATVAGIALILLAIYGFRLDFSFDDGFKIINGMK